MRALGIGVFRVCVPALRAVALVGCVLGASAVHAWPDRTVKLVVPYVPGAMGDTVSRLLADELRPRLGQPVIVENRPGAGGNIGAAAVAQSGADGHTFLVAATNNLVINQFVYPDLRFDPLQAFVPVSILVDVPAVIFVSASVPATTFPEFVSYARANRGKLNYASPGAATTTHLLAEILNRRYDLGMTHVSYKGSAPALTALLANEVQLFIVGAGVGAPHARAGKIRPLAVSSRERMAAFPDTPTFAQAGIADVIASNWWAIAAPAGTPKDVVERMNRALREALEQPKVRARLAELGAIPIGNSAEDMGKQLAREADFWSRATREIGAKAE
ncbi:MAG: tripartite tricarboxylate transporter substrate-binding protein [Burkholderiales bacterium]